MIRNKHAILGMTFVSLGLLGALLSAIGASLPALQKFFSATIEQTALVTVIFQLSYSVFCFLGGFLTDFFGKSKVLIVGGILYGTCTLLLGTIAAFDRTLLLFAISGIGGGLLFIGANTMIVQLFPENRGKYLNLLHLCFAIGSVAASLLVSAFISAGYGWSRVFELLGLVALATGFFFVFAPAGAPTEKFDGTTLKRLFNKYKLMLGNRLFLKLLVANTLAIGTQFGTIYLLVLFLNKTRGLPHSSASIVLATYFVLLGTGRIICSSLISRYPITKIVTFLLVLLFTSLSLGWLTRGPVSILFFTVTGLASSGLMPSLLALASHMLPKEVTGLALGIMSMCGGIGGMGITKFVSWIANGVGLNTSFLALIFLSLTALIYFTAMKKKFAAVEGRAPR